MTDDQLARAAQRAQRVLPEPIARLVREQLANPHICACADDCERQAIATAVLALPVSAPDRDALMGFVDDAIRDADADDTQSEASAVADALIAAGLVRTPVTAEQVEAGARTLHERICGGRYRTNCPEHWSEWVPDVITTAKALGLSVVEGGEQRG